jgi:hypothetical protein
MRPAQIAQLAERFSSHSVWCSGHILVIRKPGADSHTLCHLGANPVPNNPLERTAHRAGVCGPPPVSPGVGRRSPGAFGLKS